jgi:hypothetical protein
MVTVEDFTAFPPGSDVPCEGHVGECPKCGRKGVPQKEPDRILFVHVQSSELLSDGMRTEPRDWCRVEKLAV